MKPQEIRQKSNQELQKLLKEKKSRAVELRMHIHSGNVRNVKEFQQTKKDIARIYTILKNRSEK